LLLYNSPLKKVASEAETRASCRGQHAQLFGRGEGGRWLAFGGLGAKGCFGTFRPLRWLRAQKVPQPVERAKRAPQQNWPDGPLAFRREKGIVLRQAQKPVPEPVEGARLPVRSVLQWG